MLVDSGNFSDNPTPAGEVRTRALLEGMERIGYSVVNVGERDIRLGWESFAERTEASSLTFVSANVVGKTSGEPIFPTHKVVTARAPNGPRSLRVGVVGALRFNPIFSKPGPEGEPMAIVHPREPVAAAVAALREEGVDLVVLLAAMHRDDAAKIARDVPGIDFVLGSYGGVYSPRRDDQDGTALIYAGNQGKRLGVARVFLEKDGRVRDYTSRLHLMGSFYPNDPEMVDFVNESLAAADRAGALPVAPAAASRAATPAAAVPRGNEACRTCHAAEYRQWEASAHAKAQAGCESCHGEGARHIAAPRATGYGLVGVARCTSCHTAESSPDFDYYRDLAKVSHRP